MIFNDYKADKTKNIIFHLARKYIKGRCLDIGAGNGSFVRFMRGKHYDITGIDLFGNPDVQMMDAQTMNFDDEFDTIFMNDFIEHVTFTKTVLCNAYKALKSGGHIIVITPDNEDLSKSIIDCPHCGHKFHKTYHVKSFTEKSLARELIRAGFLIVKTKSVAMHFGAYMTGWPFTSIVSRTGRTKSLFAVGKKA